MPLYNVTVREDRIYETQCVHASPEDALASYIDLIERTNPEPDSISIDRENCEVTEVTEIQSDNPLSRGLRRMIDISTAHLSETDMAFLQAWEGLLPRVTVHRYGLILWVVSEPEAIGEGTVRLRAAGASPGLIDLWLLACGSGPDVMALNFDAAGSILPGLPRYEW